MAKMVNPNTVTDMALVNARAQMKTQQLLQKVGKGKRKVQVTLSKNVRGYLSTMTKEMKKQIKTQLGNEKQLANLFQFFNYFEKETEITKENKKEKTKNVKLSYEEVDFFKLQLKETLKGIDAQRAALKWYNLIKKALFKTLKKQTELVLEEFNAGSVKKK